MKSEESNVLAECGHRAFCQLLCPSGRDLCTWCLRYHRFVIGYLIVHCIFVHSKASQSQQVVLPFQVTAMYTLCHWIQDLTWSGSSLASRLCCHFPNWGSHFPNWGSHFPNWGSHFPNWGIPQFRKLRFPHFRKLVRFPNWGKRRSRRPDLPHFRTHPQSRKEGRPRWTYW